jgi:hypothetical protein
MFASKYQFLNQMGKPTPTSPFNPHAGRDDRSVSAQVASGLRLGLGLVCGIAIVVLAGAGISTLPTGAPAFGRYGVPASVGMLTAATIVMFWTVNRWAPYVPGFFFFPAIPKCLAIILIGPDPHSSIPSNTISRTEAMELLAYSLVVIGLTWRFVGKRPAPTSFVDRVALTFFVLATLRQVFTIYHWPPLLLISGLMALLLAWLIGLRTDKPMMHHSGGRNGV